MTATIVKQTPFTNVDLACSQKLRILCLHGHRQNGEIFKSKLGAFRKIVGKYCDFMFIDAPHKAKPIEEDSSSSPSEQLSWWFNKDDFTFKGTNKSGPAYGFQESLKLVEETWEKDGPFQGLLGFSQGGCFVSVICGLAQKKLTSVKPDFAVIVSGFISGSLVHKCAYEDPIKIPTLFVYGLEDTIIPPNMCMELLCRFHNVVSVEHNGGHYLPATSLQKNDYIKFFQRRLQHYMDNRSLQASQP